MLLLLCGNYKTGKTVSAATFPKPMLWLDYDDGFESVFNTTDLNNELIVKDSNLIEVIPFHRQEVYDIFLLTDTGKKASPPHVKEAGNLTVLFNEIIRSLKKDGCYKDKGPYETVVIDSSTEMIRIWKEGILLMNNQGSLSPGDYGTLEEILYGQFIPSMKTILSYGIVKNIILISHIAFDKDAVTGALQEFPIAPSRNMNKTIGSKFSEIWQQRVEGSNYVWRTKQVGLFQAGSRLHLPDPIKPATYQQLEVILKGRVKL